MAATSAPLVWDFYRKVEGAQGLGGVVHYHDETAQSIYLNGGLSTRLESVPEGHWRESSLSFEYKISSDAWTDIGLDHTKRYM